MHLTDIRALEYVTYGDLGEILHCGRHLSSNLALNLFRERLYVSQMRRVFLHDTPPSQRALVPKLMCRSVLRLNMGSMLGPGIEINTG